jgi:hypothetical protein
VYDRLADIPSHLEWGGRRQRKNYRLLSIEAPDGPATVGAEFASTGADAMGEFADSSIVTEATRPRLLEFVTEARLSTKKGRVKADGCLITYTFRTLRISELPGAMVAFEIPGLRAIGLRIGGSNLRNGLRNLARLAEQGVESR